MDRHNTLHKASRVELPDSLKWSHGMIGSEGDTIVYDATEYDAPRTRLADIMGRAGVFTCGLAVVATASLLALWVR